jgi:heat shock protein HslJ
MPDFDREEAAFRAAFAKHADEVLIEGQPALHRARWVAPLLSAAVVVAVVGGTTLLLGRDDSPKPPPAASSVTPSSKPIVLDGDWRVVALTDEDGKSLLKSDKVRVRFSEGKVGGSTECNGFGYSPRYKRSGRGGQNLLILGHYRSTLVGCNETPIANRLKAVRHVSESDGVLRLQAEDETNIVTLVRVGTSVVLEGEWRVTALLDTEGRSVLTGWPRKVTIKFSAGNLAATTGCNGVTAKYQQQGPDGRDVVPTRTNTTLVACAGLGNEPPLLERLQAVRHVSEENGNLYLQDDNWATIATLVRVGASTEPTQYPTVPPEGDLATWTLAPGQNLTEYSTEFTALVTRLACHDGVTGKVLGPAVRYQQKDIVVSFTAAKPEGEANEVFNCQGNDSVPVAVHLAHPLGDSKLVDGQCVEVPGTSPCYFDHGVRWPTTAR